MEEPYGGNLLVRLRRGPRGVIPRGYSTRGQIRFETPFLPARPHVGGLLGGPTGRLWAALTA
jgi:hypothetical protein